MTHAERAAALLEIAWAEQAFGCEDDPRINEAYLRQSIAAAFAAVEKATLMRAASRLEHAALDVSGRGDYWRGYSDGLDGASTDVASLAKEIA